MKRHIPTIGSVKDVGSPYKNYLTRIVGGDSFLDLLRYELLTFLFEGMPGALGVFSRSWFYPRLMNIRGKVFLGKDISLRCPGKIFLEDGCYIDDLVRFDAKTAGKGYIQVKEHTVIRSFTLISTGGDDGYVDIGRNCFIGQSCQILGYGGVKIGNDVLLAGQVFITASSHVMDNIGVPIKDQGITVEGVEIGDGCWIGAGVTILDGITIGEGSVIGAGAVVSKSIPPYSIAVGIPARVIKSRTQGTY